MSEDERKKLDARTAVIVAYHEKYGEVDLPTICIALRMSCNGAADPWGDKFLADTVQYLRDRTTYWFESRLPLYNDEAIIDSCVRKMCKAAIRIGAAEIENRNESGYWGSIKGLDGEGWK